VSELSEWTGSSPLLFPLFLLQPRGAVKPSDGHFGVGRDVYEVRPTPHSATIKPLQNPHTSAEEHSIGS